MDAITKKTAKPLHVETPELRKHLDALLDLFGSWDPGSNTRQLSFASMKLDLPGGMADWFAHAGKGGTDINAALTDVLRHVALPGARSTTQVLITDAHAHALNLDGKVAVPAGVPAHHGFDLQLQNVSNPKEAPFSAHAEADGSFHLVVEGQPGDHFSVVGLSPSGQKGASAIIGAKNPWDNDA